MCLCFAYRLSVYRLRVQLMANPKAHMEKASNYAARQRIGYLNPKPESARRIRRKLKALQRKKASIDKTIAALTRR